MAAKENLQWPELTLPEGEAKLVREVYEKADIILEYGSGGSTVVGARMPGKLIFSVESDQSWARSLQCKIDDADFPSSTILYHVDIGKIGPWGRPVDDKKWKLFHRYPVAIWNEPFFRQPDVVLIDGRFRAACFIATCLFTRKRVDVMIDDYIGRPGYHIVERLLKPVEIVGRMARFNVEPRVWSADAYELLIKCCAGATYSYQKTHDYSMMMFEA